MIKGRNEKKINSFIKKLREIRCSLIGACIRVTLLHINIRIRDVNYYCQIKEKLIPTRPFRFFGNKISVL